MAGIKYIGSISERRRRYEWKIENFMRLLEERSEERLYNTGFEFNRNQWYMEILPNLDVEDPRRGPFVELRLFRKYCRVKEHVRACLGISLVNGREREVCNRAQLIPEGESEWGRVPLVDRLYLLNHRQEILHEGKLFIYCYMAQEPIEEELGSDDEEMLYKESCKILYKDMLTMFEKGVDTDITINVKDREFRAHQTVLGARSPVFRGMLTNDMAEKKSGAITIDDLEPSAFDQFLYYVYSGKVQLLTVDIAMSLFIAADKYDCPNLGEQCVQYLESNMTTAVVMEVLKLTSLVQNERLYSSAIRCFSDHMLEMCSDKAWMKLLRENPVRANDIVRSSLQSLEERNALVI